MNALKNSNTYSKSKLILTLLKSIKPINLLSILDNYCHFRLRIHIYALKQLLIKLNKQMVNANNIQNIY